VGSAEALELRHCSQTVSQYDIPTDPDRSRAAKNDTHNLPSCCRSGQFMRFRMAVMHFAVPIMCLELSFIQIQAFFLFSLKITTYNEIKTFTKVELTAIIWHFIFMSC
jgi:hypothetical protein